MNAGVSNLLYKNPFVFKLLCTEKKHEQDYLLLKKTLFILLVITN